MHLHGYARIRASKQKSIHAGGSLAIARTHVCTCAIVCWHVCDCMCLCQRTLIIKLAFVRALCVQDEHRTCVDA